MSVEVKVPPLGESVSEAVIANIAVKQGESIAMDALMFELETDKVTLEVNAPATGVVEELAVKVGDTVNIGALLAKINANGKATSTPAAKAEAPAAVTSAPASPAKSSDHLSPAVQRIVTENNLNTSSISGTGKDGRITKGDALVASEGGNKSSTSSSAPATSSRGETRVRMTKLRQTIAKRLKESQDTAAILTTFNEVDMSEVMKLRNLFKDDFQKKHNAKLGFMSFFVKAVVAALKEIPAVNAQIDGTDIVYKNYCDIGVAVGTEQGLVVPVIRNAEDLSFSDIEKTIAALGAKARDGQLTMDDLSGGTFTITNGGTYGSMLSTPIINPPQSGILGMHNIVERPVVVNGQVEVRPIMYIALSYDHRIIDGKEAVTFLVRIKQFIENPTRLLLGL